MGAEADRAELPVDHGPVRAPESPRVRGQRRCGCSGSIARTASACAGTCERGTDGEGEAEAAARGGRDRARADPRGPTRLCEDSANARSPLGGAEDRLGPSRPHPRRVWDRSLEDARRSDRSAARRADQPLPPLTRQSWSVLERGSVPADRRAAALACGEAVERTRRLPAAHEHVAVSPALRPTRSLRVWPANSAIRCPDRVYAPHTISRRSARQSPLERSTSSSSPRTSSNMSSNRSFLLFRYQ